MDRNAQVMVKLYSKLSQCVSVGSNDASPGHSFLVLENPGTFLRPDFDLVNADNRYLWASTLNRIPQNTWIYQDTGRCLDSLYERVLSDKELADVTLTGEQRRKLKEARDYLTGWMGGESRELKAYKKYKQEYEQAYDQYSIARADSQNHGAPLSPVFVQRLNQARQDWIAFGFRNEVDAAYAAIANLTALDANIWWQNLANAFGTFRETNAGGVTFPQTSTFPTYEAWNSSGGWTRFVFNERDEMYQVTSTHTRIGGGLNARWGLWRLSPSGSYSQDAVFSQSEVGSYSISVELLKVRIMRPWMDPLVFRTRAWRWKKGSPSSSIVISTGGDLNHGVTPEGDMPFYPTGMVLARNLQLSGAFSSAEYSRVETTTQSSGSIGWGPFSLSGRYFKQQTSEYSRVRQASNSVTNPDPQIIAWSCDVLPLCPNPDPTLDWPSRLDLDHLPEFSADWRKRQRREQ